MYFIVWIQPPVAGDGTLHGFIAAGSDRPFRAGCVNADDAVAAKKIAQDELRDFLFAGFGVRVEPYSGPDHCATIDEWRASQEIMNKAEEHRTPEEIDLLLKCLWLQGTE